MPFWAIGVLIVLALFFFLSNYVSGIAWNMRAQNAADGAAQAALTVQSNIWNEESMLLYAAALDEYRLRALNQAIINTIANQGGCTTTNCDSDYRTLVAEFNNALAGYTSDIHLLGQADQLSQGGQQQDERKLLAAIGKNGNCSAADCAFTYNSVSNNPQCPGLTGKNKNSQLAPSCIDLVACKNVSYIAPALLNMTATTYPVYGRAAAAVASVSPAAAFNPGTQTNPKTGQPYQPTESQWTVGALSYVSTAYTVNFSGLNVSVNWYTAVPIQPPTNNVPKVQISCS